MVSEVTCVWPAQGGWNSGRKVMTALNHETHQLEGRRVDPVHVLVQRQHRLLCREAGELVEERLQRSPLLHLWGQGQGGMRSPGGIPGNGRVGAARLGAQEWRPAMNGPELLEHAAGLVNRRRREYGEPVNLFEHVAAQWSLTLGIRISPEQVVLCLIELKLARLARDPKHLDSQVDVAGYAAVLREVSR
jgi:hypothetical protein